MTPDAPPQPSPSKRAFTPDSTGMRGRERTAFADHRAATFRIALLR